MKKFTFLSIALLGSLIMFACQLKVSQNVKINSDFKSATTLPIAHAYTEIQDVIDYSSDEKTPEQNVTSPVLVNELNTPDLAQSYPWLNNNALRVYYTHGTEMYVASRNDVNAKFGKGHGVLTGFKETVISGWLMPDELKIYIATQSSKLYSGSRKSLNENFSSFTEIKLLDAPPGSLFDASFTPDMEELMMYNNDKRERIVKFTKTAPNEYTFAGEVNVLSKETPTGGQLSRDGLRFYVPFKRTVNGNDDYRYIYVLTRKGMHDNFNGIEQVKTPEVINITAYQPTINADETQMMFVTGADNLWDNNELCSVTLSKEEIVTKTTVKIIDQSVNQVVIQTRNEQLATKLLIEPVVTDYKVTVIPNTPNETPVIIKPELATMRVAPNPFNERTQIEVVAPEGGHMAVEVYAMDGHNVGTLYDGDSQKGVNIINWVKNGLSNGVYTVRTTVGKSIITKKVVVCGTN